MGQVLCFEGRSLPNSSYTLLLNSPFPSIHLIRLTSDKLYLCNIDWYKNVIFKQSLNKFFNKADTINIEQNN